MKRSSGIIMPITSLPGDFGIGTLGREAYEFIDFLDKAGQGYWQVLPLVQTGYGDSPYQSISVNSGNPFLIDLEKLEELGFLTKSDYVEKDFGQNPLEVDYGKIYVKKMKVLKRSFEKAKSSISKELNKFKEEESFWIEDYGLFMALKEYNQGKSFMEWDDKTRKADEEILKKYRVLLYNEIEYYIYLQYIFNLQWIELKKYANEKGIKIIGDIPIYVAEDSVDLWSNPNCFKLDKNNRPTVVAGCPPDAFSEDGQLWGNPIYDWEYHKKTKYRWWLNRFKRNSKLYDVLRLDHFRGFEAYWEIPAKDKTAKNGKWVKGPGIELFNLLKEELGDIEIIAEDLGYITEDLYKFREDTGFPGMKVLQFAFDNSLNSDYLPHKYNRKCVVYTGTHDNDTIIGWCNDLNNKEEVENAKKYLNLTKEEGYNIGIIRGAWSSVADLAITLMQDFLAVDSEGRINKPATVGWWKWRIDKNQLTEKLAEKILDITKLYGREK